PLLSALRPLTSFCPLPYASLTSTRQVMQELQNVRENTHRGDVGAGARTLHDQRRPRVAPGDERNNVVVPLRQSHRVVGGQLSQRRACAGALDASDISQDRTTGARTT